MSELNVADEVKIVHWYIAAGMYLKMRDDIAVGKSNRMILADKKGFDEYQASYATSQISYGENSRHYWNEVTLFNQHECWINTQKVNLRQLNKVFKKYGGKY